MSHDGNTEAAPPAPAGAPSADPDLTAAAIGRHREVLKEAFPMPDPAALAARRPRGKLIASLLLATALAGVLWADPAWHRETYHTGTAERRTLTLPDGSQVTLDSNTTVAVAQHLRTRRVALADGRVLFDVASSRWRPFEVNAGAASVRVTGTLFDVRRNGEHVGVTVSEGQVRVRAADAEDTVWLAAGQHVDARAGRLERPVEVDARARIAWTEGRMEFQRTPLTEVVEELQRYRTAAITLTDPDLAALRLSGVFSSDQAEQVLQLLPDVLPVQVVVEQDGTATILPR